MGFWKRLFGGDRRDASSGTTMTAAPGADMRGMVRMLARAPEEQRRTMLADRLAVFARQSENQRAGAMRMMLDAALELPDDDYRRLAGSRMQVLMGLAPDEQMTLMRTHLSVLEDLAPEKRAKEMSTMKALTAEMPAERRKMVAAMMEKLGMKLDG
jgi:flagellar motor component MotA